MPPPITLSQLEEYGILASEANLHAILREMLSLNLYWMLAAIDAHIPLKYRASISTMLLESVQTTWWHSGHIGPGTWEEYQIELEERRSKYGRLVDEEGMNPTGVCVEAVSQAEDQGLVSPEDRPKLLVLFIDYTPAAEYGRLLEAAG